MTFWEPESIKSTVGGNWLARPDSAGAAIDGFSTDTRQVRRGQGFIAIRGEKFDGNTFIAGAATAGATLAIVDRPEAMPSPLPMGMAVLHVPDSNIALLRLAAAYRRTLEGTRVIAVTGSNGKTTTTRLCEQVLSRSLRGTASPKSFNNRVGVPLTILSAKRGDQFLICEVGTNAPGEIAELAGVVQPDIVVITSIGREHLEGLGSIRGAVSEAVSLLSELRPGGLAVINADAPLLDEAVSAVGQGAQWSVLRFGTSENADVRITSVEPTPAGITFILNGRTSHGLPLLGRHNALNAAASIAVGRRMGVAPEAIDAALAEARGPEMRLERRRIGAGPGSIEVINDAYNANPESVLAALDTFAQIVKAEPPRGRRVVVLGDMLELGESGPDAHREIGDAVVGSGVIDLAVFVGPLSMFGVERVRKTWPANRVVPIAAMDADGVRLVASLLSAGDCVLLKGSRGMALERLLPAIEKTLNAAGETGGARASALAR